MNIHIQIYELTKKLNKLLKEDKIPEAFEIIKERAKFINSLDKVEKPSDTIKKEIMELEEENSNLLKKLINEKEEELRKLKFGAEVIAKYEEENTEKIIDFFT